jgi:predicted ABC-type ATPase
MNLASAIELFGYGTSEGVTKAWDTRGRGRTLRPGESTEDHYRSKETGLWNPQRSAMHDQVIAAMVEGKVPPKDRAPVAHVLGGGTASGKTTMSRSILGDDPNTLRVDPDEMKTKIPEYDQLKQDDPNHAALRVHEESSYLTKSLMAEAIARGLDLTYDATTSGKGSIAMVKTLLDQGYKVHVMFADVPLEVARQRADLRARESDDPMNRGRFVPDSVINESHQRAAQNFLTLKDMPGLSSTRLYDNSGKMGEQKLVFSKQGEGKGTVHDEKFFDRYKTKAFKDVSASIQRHGRRRFPIQEGRRRTQQAY